MTGSSNNCNARCTIMPIVQPSHGDKCCPKGANALNDDDCEPKCGNGVAELGEECDGGDLCTPDCRVLTRAQRQCMDLTDSASPACKACSCRNCADAMVGCYQSGNEMRDMLCTAIVECANRTGCTQNECFCGTGCAAPNGPCREEIVAGANTPYAMQVFACSNMETCPVHWSRQISECRATTCAEECALPSDGGLPATGPAPAPPPPAGSGEMMSSPPP
jgi:hypothetical protein